MNKTRFASTAVLVCLLGLPCRAQSAGNIHSTGLLLDEAVKEAVKADLIPGGVLIVGHQGRIVYRKAYGHRALIPRKEPMTTDTIFDAASLTKVVATMPSVMKLFEEGKLRIDDPVTKYLPKFEDGHSEITVRNLLTHFSGSAPGFDS